MKRLKVFLTGGDEIGWAVDEDLKLTRRSVQPVADLVSLQESEVVHSVWWWQLLGLREQDLVGKRIVCHMPGEPFRVFTLPEHRPAVRMVGRWVTRSTQAKQQLQGFGIDSVLIPYLVDVETFRPLPKDDPDLLRFKEQWSLPTDAYLIGSFQRDTEGADLKSPKSAKGPDVLLEILRGLRKRDVPGHAVTAGPRRHWLLRRLRSDGIPFTYIGTQSEQDDIEINSLSRSVLNILYNLVDLCVVGSRSEGGPHAILEAAAARCKIVSTPVGMAPDVLNPACIFRSPADAVEIVLRDTVDDSLAEYSDEHYERVQERHRPESAEPLFRDLYKNIGKIEPFAGVKKPGRQSEPAADADAAGTAQPRMQRSTGNPLVVGLWHSFFKPPYGGGNQFMMALRKGLARLGVDVRENELHEGIDAYVLNSIHFDVDRFLEFSRRHRINVVHRIDGPIFLIRGFDREKDELCYRLNDQFASATVLQSGWTYSRIIDMGHKPVNPVVIHNAVDDEIFHSIGRVPFERNRKIRLISSSWSNNPRKGGPLYKWIEDHLDWDRFDYTFVGNVSERFSRMKHIPPVPSEELASILRGHDVYITASRNDPCSNAVIEALACGLPVLYLNEGGHPELVGYGGLPFHGEEDVLEQLERLAADYESFQSLITVPRLSDVAERYLTVIRETVG